MTKQRSAQRLAEAGADQRADFEIDAQVSASKEQSGLSRLRDDLLMRSRVEQIEALAAGRSKGSAVIAWEDGQVWCSIIRPGQSSGLGDYRQTILAAIVSAIEKLTETGV